MVRRELKTTSVVLKRSIIEATLLKIDIYVEKRQDKSGIF